MASFRVAHTRVFTYLAAMVPFAWLLPWLNFSLIRGCEFQQRQIVADGIWRSHSVCPGNLVLGDVMNLASILAPLIELGIPLFYVIMFFNSGTQLVSLKTRDTIWKLQVLALDIFDVCAFAAQALSPEVLRHFQHSHLTATVFLVLIPVALISVLMETTRVFRLTECKSRPAGGIPVAVRKQAMVGLGSPFSYTFAMLVSFNLPFVIFRLGVLFRGITMSQQGWVLKNLVCCVNQVMIMSSGSEDNNVSRSIRRMVGMLPGHELVEQSTAAEIYTDTSSDLKEKVEDLTILLDNRTEATKRLAFQRAVLAAQANIVQGVSDLDTRFLIEGFQAFDVNHDNRLSRDEVKLMMKAVANIVDARDTDRLMFMADVNEDGQIDYCEFANKLVMDPEIKARVLTPYRWPGMGVFS